MQLPTPARAHHRLLLPLLVVSALAACSSGGGDPAPPPPRSLARVDVTPASPWLVEGSTMRFYATAVYSDATSADVTEQAGWSSSAAGTLQLSTAAGSRGLATALATGSATVTASFDGVSGSTGATVVAAGTGNTVVGTVTYDFVPATYDPATDRGTLAFGAATERPVRGALVRVMQGTTKIAETTTDDAGHYGVTFLGAGTVTVVALAKTVSPPIQVEDNTDADAVWAIGASLAAGNATVNLHATHGWTGSTYDATARTAAPFAILDSMYTASRGFLDAGRDVPFPALKVNWSPDNVSSSTVSYATGLIGTSHYQPGTGEIYILGKVGEDTDEFDNHVIVHEWAHYFEANLSRSDSPGGPHGTGDVLDPRLAFGEGYGTAIASILLADPIYADTGWWNGYTLDAFGFSAETTPSPTDDFDTLRAGLNPGPFSEMSVIRALWDLWDDSGTAEFWDSAAIPLATFYDVLVGPERTTPAFTTIASFVAGLKAQPGVGAAAVDAVLGHYSIGPISDAWGAGDADLRAMYRNVSVPSGTQSFTLDGRYDWNMAPQNRFLVFTATGSTATVSGSSSYDVDLEAYHQGVLLDYDWSTNATPSVHFATTPGEVYVVLLTGWGTVNGTYAATVNVSTP